MNAYKAFSVSVLIVLVSSITGLSAMFNPYEDNIFIDVEKNVMRQLDMYTLSGLGQTSVANYKKAHEAILEKHQKYLVGLIAKISSVHNNLEQKMRILEEGLHAITRTYIQKTNENYEVLQNQRPNVGIIKTTIIAVNGYIAEELNKNTLDCYTKKRYATIFWNFLKPITKNAYIVKKDKKEIGNCVDKNIQKLKVEHVLPEYPNGKSLGNLLNKKNSTSVLKIFFFHIFPCTF